jgi:hypothetical protein
MNDDPRPEPNEQDLFTQQTATRNFSFNTVCENGLPSTESTIPAFQSNTSNLDPKLDFNQESDLLLGVDFGFDSMGFADLSEVHPNPNSGLDWMFTNTWNHNLPSEMSAFVENSNVNSNVTHIVATRGGESLGPGPLVPLNNANNDHSPLSTNENVSLLDTPSNHPHNRCDPDDPWPMEWYAASLQDSELPMLGQPVEPGINGSSFFGMEPMIEGTRLKMKEAAMLASGSALWPALNLTHFPTKEKLDHCIDLYFAHSHRVSLTLIFCTLHS